MAGPQAPSADHDFRQALAAQQAGRFQEAVELLARAGAQDHVPALSMLGGQLMSGRGVAPNVRAGLGMIRRAAELGGAYAWAVLAAALGFGLERPPDWNAALDHLQRSAELGHESAQAQLRILAELSGPGPGGSSWASLRREVDLQAWFSPPPTQELNADPEIRIAPGLAPPSVCRWLIERVRDRLEGASVYDAVQRRAGQRPERTNSQALFGLTDGDLVVFLLCERLAAAAGLPVAAMEAPQVLHYAVGQEFRPHFDFLRPDAPATAASVAQHGQRIATCLVYLNDGFEGGETDFPTLGLRYRGHAGDALMFRNVDRSGAPDPRTLHAGLPPNSGEKWLFSQWVRDRPVR